MQITAQVVAVVVSIVLVLEFILHGIAMLVGMEAGLEPIRKHLGFQPGRALVLLIGVVDIVVAAAIAAGFWLPAAGLAGAGYAVALFGSLMVIRLRRRLGTLLRPPDFPIFLASAVLLLATYLVR